MNGSRPGSWKSAKNSLTLAGSIAALLACGYGVYRAVHSPLFWVRVVEVSDQPENAPVDAQGVIDLAAVPVDRASLFDLDLGAIESRILSHEWVKSVHLQKRYPQTLVVSVDYREPQALIQHRQGQLSYVDQDGKIFGKAKLAFRSDLPLLSESLFKESADRRIQALKILSAWEKSKLDALSPVSTLIYEPEKGFRVLASYPLFRLSPTAGNGPHPTRARTMIDLGPESGPELSFQLERLRSVFQYLADNGIAVRQIYADAGKKIVVKFAHGS